jgi:ABC-type transport system involved in cytochrome bd biosynthesis fused ATPase/permease subunit
MILLLPNGARFSSAAMKPLLDQGFSGERTFSLWLVPAAVIGIFVVRGFATFTGNYVLNWVGQQILRELQRDVCPPDATQDRSHGFDGWIDYANCFEPNR